MTVYKLYYGGDERHVGYNHSRVTGHNNPVVRYAGHLPTKHFILPFEYNGAADEWKQFRAMHDAFQTGDVVHTHLISQDSRVDALVVHNKKAAGVKDENTGAVTTPAKVKFGLYDGETLVKETAELDLSKVGRTVLEFGNAKSASSSATVLRDTNSDGTPDAATTTTTTTTTMNGTYMNGNGTIRMTVVDGSGFNGVCLTAFLELVDFLCVRPCGCEEPECESEYPDPICR